MKKYLLPIIFVLVPLLSISTIFTFAEELDVGQNSCGYTMMIVPYETSIYPSTNLQPAILDAWTTNDPENPTNEVYEFTRGQDIMAFVVQYSHAGGVVPEQWAVGGDCNTEEKVKTCHFNWTVQAPPGIYLLITFADPVQYKQGHYDWAARIGQQVIGWPKPIDSRPLCFSVSN